MGILRLLRGIDDAADRKLQAHGSSLAGREGDPATEYEKVDQIQNPVKRAIARVWYWGSGGPARDAGRSLRSKWVRDHDE
jgi:hypothetical protein